LKKVLIALLVLLLLIGGLVLAWKLIYDEQPETALLRTAAAAMLGDEKAFLEGFTEDSRPLVGAALSLAKGEDMARSPRHPYYYLTTENIVSTEKDDLENARVRVRRPGDDKSAGYDIPMARVCDKKYLIAGFCLLPTWKIDGKKFDAKRLDNDR
jgi:hypothetical protein